MSKIAVVYWSATGNTEAMANAVAQGAREAGADAEVISASEFDPSKADSFEAIAFGCPARLRCWRKMSLSRCSQPAVQS